MSTAYFLSLFKKGSLNKKNIERLVDIMLSEAGEVGIIYPTSKGAEDAAKNIGIVKGNQKNSRGKLSLLIKFLDDVIVKEGFVLFSYQNVKKHISGSVSISKEQNFIEFSLNPDVMTPEDIKVIIHAGKLICSAFNCSYGYLLSDSFTNEMLPNIKEILETNKVDRLYDINFWNPNSVEYIGKKGIDSLQSFKPHCQVESLKDGGVLLAHPIAMYKGSFVGFNAGERVASRLRLGYCRPKKRRRY